MSDFGANIFDDTPAPTEPSAGKRKGRTKKSAPAAPAEPAPPPVEAPAAADAAAPPMTVDEVPVNTAQRVHDDVQEVVFRPMRGGPARQREAAPQEAPPVAAAPEPAPLAPAPAEREPRAFDDRPRREDRPRRDDRDDRDAPPPRHPDRHHQGDRRRDEGRHGERREHGRQDQHRQDHRRHERSEPRGDRPHPTRSELARSNQTAPATTSRVALLVDLPALQAEARAQGGELAVTRLRASLAAGSPIDTAVCFVSGRGRPPHGFEVIDAGDPLTSGIRFAAKATELASRGLHLVLAPASNAMLELARLLRGSGHAIELAGFVGRDDDQMPTRRLGRDCLFVP